MSKSSSTQFIGSKLAEIRKEAGFTQQTLAEAVNSLGRVNVTWRHIYRLDKNLSAPMLPLAQEIALILGKEINEIWIRKQPDEN